MNVMWYIGKFDEATWNLLAQCGLTEKYFNQELRGMVAVDQHTIYKRELLAGMTIQIISRILNVGDKSIKFIHEMKNTRTDEVAATTIITGIHISRTKRTACYMPVEIRDLALKLVTQ
jgi:acyl-CoA thioester hydrolase